MGAKKRGRKVRMANRKLKENGINYYGGCGGRIRWSSKVINNSVGLHLNSPGGEVKPTFDTIIGIDYANGPDMYTNGSGKLHINDKNI